MAKKKRYMVLVCPECHGTGSDLGCKYCKNTGKIKYEARWGTPK